MINLLDSGPDLLLRTDAPLTLEDRTALTRFAAEHGLPRVSQLSGTDTPETIGLLRPPTTSMSGVAIRPPPGVFLQATAEGERAIIEAVLRGMPTKITSKTRVAELYAGCGTLTFALAGVVRVAAFEGDTATVAALRQAINQGGMAGRVEAVQRDLARQPLSAKELGAFAAVVLDPPHGGAAAQIGQIAAAGVPTVVYVSCNPATLSRDARVLHGAGYKLAAATAIDQFLWSARLESVTRIPPRLTAPRRATFTNAACRIARPCRSRPTRMSSIESEQRVWSGRFPLDVVKFRHRRFDGDNVGHPHLGALAPRPGRRAAAVRSGGRCRRADRAVSFSGARGWPRSNAGRASRRPVRGQRGSRRRRSAARCARR